MTVVNIIKMVVINHYVAIRNMYIVNNFNGAICVDRNILIVVIIQDMVKIKIGNHL